MNILKSRFYLVKFASGDTNHMTVYGDPFTSFAGALDAIKRQPRLGHCRIVKGDKITKSIDPNIYHTSRWPLFTIDFKAVADANY